MINKDNTNNKIQFEKIGDIYYPVFNDMQPSLGFYAKKEKNILKNTIPINMYNCLRISNIRNDYLFLIVIVNNYIKNERKKY